MVLAADKIHEQLNELIFRSMQAADQLEDPLASLVLLIPLRGDTHRGTHLRTRTKAEDTSLTCI